MQVVTEHFINEEQKQSKKDSHGIFTGCKALTVSYSEKGMEKCYNWGKLERLETVHSCPARALNKIYISGTTL